MNEEDKLYRDLQLHLDKQTIGFPATNSGSDIRLLKQLFKPDQAEMAMMLTYRYQSLEQIQERAKKGGNQLRIQSAYLTKRRRGESLATGKKMAKNSTETYPMSSEWWKGVFTIRLRS